MTSLTFYSGAGEISGNKILLKDKKPSSLPFRKALKQLNVKAEDSMMVGDWPERDIQGARKIGMKTCFAKYGYTK